jgi:hypothetical protein
MLGTKGIEEWRRKQRTESMEKIKGGENRKQNANNKEQCRKRNKWGRFQDKVHGRGKSVK